MLAKSMLLENFKDAVLVQVDSDIIINCGTCAPWDLFLNYSTLLFSSLQGKRKFFTKQFVLFFYADASYINTTTDQIDSN
jgi:hypothetical protein